MKYILAAFIGINATLTLLLIVLSNQTP